MTRAWRHRLHLFANAHRAWPLPSVLLWVVVAVAGAVWMAGARLQQLHAAFETDARIVHRLLSQRVVQHDAIMATLALLQPTAADADPAAGSAAGPGSSLQRLPSVYPQILAVLQRTGQRDWPSALQAELAAAEAASRRSGHAAMAGVDLAAGRYHLVLAGTPASYALHIDLRATVPVEEWPMDRASSPVQVTLERAGQAFVVQPGTPPSDAFAIRTGVFEKVLAAPSQPLAVVATRRMGLHELPWWGMLGWCALTAALWLAAHALRRQRVARRRAEELLRLGQVARLNTLGELAAGMAHELNQPLTALLASTQAAQRLLADDPPELPDLPTARTAMARAVEQARRATAVVGRLRRLVERPDLAGQAQPLTAAAVVQDVLHLLEPEMAQRGVVPAVSIAPDLPAVLAEPVALQQIVHNLLVNALQALDQVSPAERHLALRLSMPDTTHVALSVRDHGPGVQPEAREHLFEPFYTTRTGGLGLGLTLCESLAQAMGASLVLAPRAADSQGAEFVLTLPAAPPAQPAVATTPQP